MKLSNSEMYIPTESFNFNDTALLSHTGGTTGVPKSAEFTNENFNAMVEQYRTLTNLFERGDKILTVLPMFINYGLAMGGAEVIAANYLSKMKEKGQDVYLLELMHRPTFLYKKLVEEHIPIYSVLHNGDNLLYKVINKFFGRKISLGKIPRMIDELKPDVIHLQMYSELFDLEEYGLNKVFLTIHSDLNRYLRPLSKYGKEKLQSMMQNGMHVIVLCERARKDVIAFCPSADVHVIPNGLDIDYIKSQKYDRNQLCKELGISFDTFILGHVGRFHKVKNHDKLIDIFACLHQKKPNSVLVLVGDGTAKEREHLKEIVAQKGLNDSVKFLGVRSDATAIMSCFDAFALPSFHPPHPWLSRLLVFCCLSVPCICRPYMSFSPQWRSSVSPRRTSRLEAADIHCRASVSGS